MYNLLALISGGMLSFMLMINGEITGYYGLFTATVIIHFIGCLFAFLLLKVRKAKIFPKNVPFWLYLGGAIGSFTVYFNNFAVGKINLTSIVALGLFGQTITSLIIDLFGLFGMRKNPLKKSTLIGIFFSCLGIWVMLGSFTTSAIFPIIFSFAAGITVVLSRTVNAGLARHSGALAGSFINHLVGLLVTFVALLSFGRQELTSIRSFASSSNWIYFGGILGVIVVLLFNFLVPKLTSLRMTLLIFIGQVFVGVAVDLLLGQGFSKVTFMGGLLIAFGVLVNHSLDYWQKKS